MNAKLSSLKAHFANWREWELNPIVIKELRQGVRSWTVTGMLLLFLVILFLASLGFLISESFEINPNLGLGGVMFTWFMAILAGASIIFVPLYTGVRVAAERQENNPDLLYVTTLSPARIIWGKYLCSAYIVLLFFSACMPFMAFTNLLRGVDLPTVFFILIFLFLVVSAANMAAIFLACLPASRPFKFLFVLGGLAASIGLIAGWVSISMNLMRSGVGAMMTGRDFWTISLTVAAILIALSGLLFVLSVALISPPSANRALPIRIYLTGFWLIGGVAALSWVIQTGEADRLLVWVYPTFITLLLALLVTVSNSDQLSQRVRNKIPAAGLKRFLAFFFFNGAAGGLLWIAGLVAATYFVTRAVFAAFPVPRGMTFDDDSWHILLTLANYAFAYALLALFLQRKFLPRRPPKLAGLLAIFLAGGWAIAPSIFLFFVNRLTWKSVEGLQLGNVFNVFFTREPAQMSYHQYFASAWLLVMAALNGRWFWRQVQNFHSSKAVEPAPAAATPPPMKAA
jgi:hypothetical protein